MGINKFNMKYKIDLNIYWTVFSLTNYIQYLNHISFNCQNEIWIHQTEKFLNFYKSTHTYYFTYLDLKCLLRSILWQLCFIRKDDKYRFMQHVMNLSIEKMQISINSKRIFKSIILNKTFIINMSKDQIVHLLPIFYKHEPKCYCKFFNSIDSIQLSMLYKLLTNSFRLSNNKLLKIFCKNDMSIDTVHKINTSVVIYNHRVLPVYYLSKCIKIMTIFMSESFTKDRYSKIIQGLFIQQIKLGKSLKDLIVMGCPYGNRMLLRIICEIYIKIKWLLNSPEPDTSNLINYDRFIKYIHSSSRNLLKHTIPYYSYIRKQLHYASSGEFSKMNENTFINSFNKMMLCIERSSPNIKKLLDAGLYSVSNTNLKALYKGLSKLQIKSLANKLDYYFYSRLSDESHSYIYYILTNTTHNQNRYYASINNDFINHDSLVGYTILFLTYSFYAIWSHHIFVSNDQYYQKIINETEYNMQILSNDSVQMILHITGKVPRIPYI